MPLANTGAPVRDDDTKGTSLVAQPWARIPIGVPASDAQIAVFVNALVAPASIG